MLTHVQLSAAFQFFLCEVLNFLVDVFNLYFTDVFLGGRFLKYGTQVIKFYSHSHAERRDLPNPMCTVFPTVTRYVCIYRTSIGLIPHGSIGFRFVIKPSARSCTFHSVGTAAGEQKFNSLCVLSLNIINEKIYLLLWFWFYLVTFFTGCHVIYRIAIIAMPFTRYEN